MNYTPVTMKNKNYITFLWVIIDAISNLPALITKRKHFGLCKALSRSLSQNRKKKKTMIQKHKFLIITKYWTLPEVLST